MSILKAEVKSIINIKKDTTNHCPLMTFSYILKKVTKMVVLQVTLMTNFNGIDYLFQSSDYIYNDILVNLILNYI